MTASIRRHGFTVNGFVTSGEHWARHTLDAMRAQRDYALFGVSLVAILLHVYDASLFRVDASALTVLACLLGGSVVAVAALQGFVRAGRLGRIALSYGFGVPAFAAGTAIHGAHVAMVGLDGSDITGLLMLAAGVALILMASVKTARLIHTWWRRLLLLPVAYLGVFYLMVPLTFGVFVANVPHVLPDKTPADYGFAYESVTFPTAQGETIAAWYIASQNGAAVITVHGASGNRGDTLGQAAVLAKHGYGVLLIDVEGFGGSTGRTNDYGLYGDRDVAAAVDYLKTRPEVDASRIGALGLSMGGEIVLTSAAQQPDLRAVVAEGASARTWQDYLNIPGGTKWAEGPPVWLAMSTGRLLSGAPQPAPLKDLVPQIAPRDVLLISAAIPGERNADRLYQQIGGRQRAALGDPGGAAHRRARPASGGVRAARRRLLRRGAGGAIRDLARAPSSRYDLGKTDFEEPDFATKP